MKICMIGTGYVGLVSGVCFSEFGFEVTCVDQDQAKIARLNKGEIPIFEPGLDDMVARNASSRRLSFTTDLPAAVETADVIFIAVGTPSRRGDGEADLQYVHAAAKQIAASMRDGATVVVKSTVVVGTCREVAKTIRQARPDADFSICSNPEFLREGSAIEDFMRPDRVVCGVDDERGRNVLEAVYRPLFIRETPIVFTSLENAEITKYAANAFLAMKITFINEIANLCEAAGGDVQSVASAIGLDKRIGSKFLHAGPGYGGSCFPKDTRAFMATGRKYDAPLRLVEETEAINEARKVEMAERVLSILDDDHKGMTAAILGIAFKPNTDDIREAPSLAIIERLQAAGVTIRATDPEAMENAKNQLDNVTWCEDAYQAADGADIVVVVTEWNVFRGLNLARVKELMQGDVLLDLRNIYTPLMAADAGLRYSGIGRSDQGQDPGEVLHDL